MMQIVTLNGSHDRKNFDCGKTELNLWLQQIARQHQDKGLSKTFVAVQEHQPNRICGYFALTLSELDNRQLPESLRKKLPSRLPAVRLGRLAVDLTFQSKKLGELLLIDALNRAQRIYQEAGGIGLFVDAIDSHAAGFYQHFGFQATPDNPLLLFLSTRSVGF